MKYQINSRPTEKAKNIFSYKNLKKKKKKKKKKNRFTIETAFNSQTNFLGANFNFRQFIWEDNTDTEKAKGI